MVPASAAPATSSVGITRAIAAAIVARSCAVRAQASPRVAGVVTSIAAASLASALPADRWIELTTTLPDPQREQQKSSQFCMIRAKVGGAGETMHGRSGSRARMTGPPRADTAALPDRPGLMAV